MELFELGGGSIPGKDHLFNGNLLVGKNNQDAFQVSQTSGLTIAVVADGCGSKPQSEQAQTSAPNCWWPL